ncbi:MAG TPA: hypothetical protein VGM05_09550 [Planctomycetaceae bacterium]
MPLHWPRLALILCLTAASGGCPHDSHIDSYTRQKPTANDLVGTYKLTAQNLNDRPIAELKSPAGLAAGPCTIKLYADGILEYRHVPIWVGNWANGVDQWSIKEFASGSGKWEIDVVGGTRDPSGVVELYGLKLTDASLADSTLLLGSKPPYEIVFEFGDADAGNAMRFEIVPE